MVTAQYINSAWAMAGSVYSNAHIHLQFPPIEQEAFRYSTTPLYRFHCRV